MHGAWRRTSGDAVHRLHAVGEHGAARMPKPDYRAAVVHGTVGRGYDPASAFGPKRAAAPRRVGCRVTS